MEWQVNTYVLYAEEYRSYQICNIDLFPELLFLFDWCRLDRASVIITKGCSYMSKRLQHQNLRGSCYEQLLEPRTKQLYMLVWAWNRRWWVLDTWLSLPGMNLPLFHRFLDLSTDFPDLSVPLHLLRAPRTYLSLAARSSALILQYLCHSSINIWHPQKTKLEVRDSQFLLTTESPVPSLEHSQ